MTSGKRRCAEIRTSEGSKVPIHDGSRKCLYRGGLDGEGRPHGDGALAYDNNNIFRGAFDHGAWNRTGRLVTVDADYVGRWADGLMEGEMRVEDKCVTV